MQPLFCKVFLLLFAALLPAACHPVMPPRTAQTGIEGRLLRGPVQGGPVRTGTASESPVHGHFRILDEEGREVKTFSTDAEGRFRVALPPGTYTLVPGDDVPIYRPGRQRKPLTVGAEGFTTLRIVFDTGMR